MKKTINKLRNIAQNIKRKPELIFIEPTNLCNLDCPFCLVNTDETYNDSHHSSMKRSFGKMELSTFEKILMDAHEFGITRLFLEFFGEPLLHPHFDEMVIKTKKYNFKTQVFTNGISLNKRHLEVIPNNLAAVCFSIDGASRETYNLNRQPVNPRTKNNFEKSFKNILKLNELCKGTKTEVRWQFIVVNNNEHEMEIAKKIANKNKLRIVFKKYNPSDVTLIPGKQEWQKAKNNKPCKIIYNQFGILWNGDIVPCCQDPDGRQILGNVKNNTIDEIWNSNTYTDFRDRVGNALNKPECEPDICNTCLAYE